MKLIVITALVASLSPFAAAAQTAPAAATAAAAPAPASGAAKFTLDTPIATLVADAKAKAVLDTDLPGLTTHPAYEQFKTMSLRAVQPYSAGGLTDDMLKKVESDLAVLK